MGEDVPSVGGKIKGVHDLILEGGQEIISQMTSTSRLKTKNLAGPRHCPTRVLSDAVDVLGVRGHRTSFRNTTRKPNCVFRLYGLLHSGLFRCEIANSDFNSGEVFQCPPRRTPYSYDES